MALRRDELETLRAWRDEGFDVMYLPYGNGGKAFSDQIRELGNKTALGDYFAVVGIYSPHQTFSTSLSCSSKKC